MRVTDGEIILLNQSVRAMRPPRNTQAAFTYGGKSFYTKIDRADAREKICVDAVWRSTCHCLHAAVEQLRDLQIESRSRS